VFTTVCIPLSQSVIVRWTTWWEPDELAELDEPELLHPATASVAAVRVAAAAAAALSADLPDLLAMRIS